jgi:hypothetical protein
MTDSNRAIKLAQGFSLETATRHRDGWVKADLELLQGTLDLPPLEVAECLGRTAYAVLTARQALKEGRLGSHRQHVQVARPVQVCPDCFEVKSLAGTCSC